MENVAHALAGLLVAKGVVALRERREGARPSARFVSHAAWVSALANNVPDGDMVLTPLTGGKLGYLLHHRGHTHTLPIGILLGLAVALVSLAWWKRRAGSAAEGGDRRWLLLLGAVGPIVHLTMDGWNTYGVHPFWPIVDRWFYGDAVFIVEPLLWLAAVPFLFRDAVSRAGRVILGLIGALGLGLPWLVGSFVPLELRLVILAFGAGTATLAWRLPAERHAPASLLAFFVVPAMFLGTGVAARAVVARATAEAFPGESTVDIASTAWPSNPLCWSAITVTTSSEGELVLRRASLALAPSILPLARCPSSRGDTITAPLTEVRASPRPDLRWEGEHRTPLARWRELGARCDVAAAMRFIRVPFLVEKAESLIVGDLRFDRDERLDFGELELPLEVGPCPKFVPPWEPPRVKELSAPR